MTRGITPTMETALDAPVSRPALLGKFEFDSGTVYAWSGVGELSWDGQTWIGVGQFLEFDLPEERSDGSSEGAVFRLSGLDAAWVSLALNEDYQNRPAWIWYGELESDFSGMKADPILMLKGKMDVMALEDDAKKGSIELTVERMHFDNRTRNERYDHQEQLRQFPGDLGLEFLASLQEKQLPLLSPDTQGSNPLPPRNPRGQGRTGTNPGSGADDSSSGGYVRGRR